VIATPRVEAARLYAKLRADGFAIYSEWYGSHPAVADMRRALVLREVERLAAQHGLKVETDYSDLWEYNINPFTVIRLAG
jgi:hypothetical protein